jgi:hypothetical protein
MVTRSLTLLFIAALAAQAQAQSGASWLGYSSNARNLAEAGGLGSLAQGSDGMGLNPAGLADLPGNGEVQASYGVWPGDISVQHAQAAVRTGMGVLGVQGSWIDFGSVNAYTVDPVNGVQATGSMQPHASDIGLALGSHLGALALGVEGHMLMEDLTGQGNSSAAAFDAGARMDVLPALTASLAMVNLGGSLDGSSLPSAVKTGIALRSSGGNGWEAGLEASSPMAGGQADLAAAFRFQVASPLALRAGWLQGAGIQGTWSMGASFQMGILGVDYGFRQMNGFSPVHDFTLRLLW